MKTRPTLLFALGVLIASSSCGYELEGPSGVKVDDQRLLYCAGERQQLVITGAGLSPMVVEGATEDPDVQMPRVCLTPEGGGDAKCLSESDVHWVSQREIRFDIRQAWLRENDIQPGNYNATVQNPDGTQASGNVTVRLLSEEVLVFWADPSVVYKEIATTATIYGAGIDREEMNREESAVLLRPSGQEEGGTELETAPSQSNNRVQATIPAGTVTGTYDIVVRLGAAGQGCEAVLFEGLKVTDVVDLPVTRIDPEFGLSTTRTPVTITGEPGEFDQVPRAYLNAVNASASTVAVPIEAMTWLDAGRLTGVVPAGLNVGDYDLIVVNPDERVGRLPAAFKVTSAAPPVIDNISPNYLDTGSSAAAVTVEGSGFDTAVAPLVTATCILGDGVTEVEAPAAATAGTETSFNFTLDTTVLDQGSVCVIRVTNADGSYFEYSAIGLSNPASNLAPWRAGPDMTVERRAHATTAGRVTRAQRFIYAIGGDDGSVAGAKTSVEATPIDIYGTPGAWFELPVALPAPRTMAGVVNVGRFLYLVGGNDGTGPVNSLLRAQILNPADAPRITDITAARGAADRVGIGEGLWYYRVSAVMGDDHKSNAGGETLPSEPLVVNLSARTAGEFGTIILRLIWDPIEGAKAYRIYRSPTGDRAQLFGSERLIGTVDAPDTDFEDVNTTADPSQAPRPLGSTGVWMTAAMPGGGLTDMISTAGEDPARQAPGVAAGRDPVDSNTWHIYVAGGLNADGVPLDTMQRMSATIQPDESHNVTAWQPGAPISTARSELTVYSVSHSEAQQVPPGTTYIYAAGGRESTNVDVATVVAGGELTWVATRTMGTMRAGYAGVSGAGFLFAFGGAQGGVSDQVISGEIDRVAPPQLINWNASERLTSGVVASPSLQPRYFAGGAVESAFIYVVGGQTSTGPSKTTQRTVL